MSTYTPDENFLKIVEAIQCAVAGHPVQDALMALQTVQGLVYQQTEAAKLANGIQGQR